jgi:hypothetical protein
MVPISENPDMGHPTFWADMGQPPKYAPIGGILFNSAQLIREHFKYLDFCDSEMTAPS